MRVEERDPSDPELDRVAIVPDSTEDLWHLQYVIETGDRVAAEISRRIQREEEHLRDTGGQRETMHATVEVTEVEFHRFADRLRVAGTIVACSREDQLGQHHTINVEVHDEIELEKRLKADQRDRLDEAVAATDDPDVLVVTVEEGRADVFDVSQRGAEHRTAATSGSGKRSGESTRTELFADVASIVGRSDAAAVVIAGPGFVKEDCADHVRQQVDLEGMTLRTVDTSAIGERGVQEVMTRGVIDDIRSDTRLAREASLLEELLERLRGDTGDVTYGPAETETAAEYGAVGTLCIVDDVLRRERSEDAEWDVDVDGVIETVERQGGTVRIFAADGEPGRQLTSLSGIAALLRYRIE